MDSSVLYDLNTVFVSGDNDELIRVGSQLFSPHRLNYAGNSAILSNASLSDASLIYMQYGEETSVATTEPLGYYAVHLPVSGRGAVQFS